MGTDRPTLLMYMQMDGTQVLVVKSETEGRAGSTPGQPAVRDEGSTTDVGVSRPRKSLGSALIPRPTIEAGTGPARVVMGDGSHWIWNIADQHFPGAIQIVDRYHAREPFSGTWLANGIPPMRRG